MPTNLPPEYFSAEERFKQAKSFSEKIAALETLIATIPKHKGTDRLRADIRRKLSNLREDSLKKSKSGKGSLYNVEKQGASMVALAGFPNSGKSSIVASLTNAAPVIADYPMSTLLPLTGMMPFEDILIQIVDLPPIGNESTDGWVSGIFRQADFIIIVIDLSEDPDIQVELILEQFEKWRIFFLKDNPPNNKTEPARKPAIIAANKADLPGARQRFEDLKKIYEKSYPVIEISAKTKEGLEELRRTLFKNSRIIRVYSKEPGKEPDTHTPFVLPEGSSVLELANRIHKEFLIKFKYACIWGSVKYPGQRVQKDYIIRDRDIVEFHLK